MPYVKSHDRNQMFMTSLDMLVDPDSHARIIDAFIDSLDLKEMGFTHTAPSEVGRPAYDPGTMLKLYLYGHRNNIRSSRKLAKACHVNIEAFIHVLPLLQCAPLYGLTCNLNSSNFYHPLCERQRENLLFLLRGDFAAGVESVHYFEVGVKKTRDGSLS